MGAITVPGTGRIRPPGPRQRLFESQIEGIRGYLRRIGRNLYAYGFVKFEDIFGNINEVGFCWRYMPGQNFYAEDNDAYNYLYVYRPPCI